MADDGSGFPVMLAAAVMYYNDDDDDDTDDDEEAGQVPRMPGITGLQWVSAQLADCRRCLDMFRMRPNVFDVLHDRLIGNYGLQSGREMCSKEALGLFLWTCGAPQSQRQATNRFEHSAGTISNRFHDVLTSVVSLAADIIAPLDPTYQAVHSRLQQHRFSHFHNCIEAIDGTHIEVIVSNDERAQHYNRKGFTSQNVLAICDLDCRFTFVCAGWPGSVHNARILQQTMETYGDRFPHPPQDKYYLVDSGYPNRLGYLAPYHNTRYHLAEFNNGSDPAGMHEVFNHRHSQLRNAVERAFGMYKGKQRILHKIPKYKDRGQCKIITVCIALHNFIIDAESGAGPTANMAAPAYHPFGLPDAANADFMTITRDFIASSLVV